MYRMRYISATRKKCGGAMHDRRHLLGVSKPAYSSRRKASTSKGTATTLSLVRGPGRAANLAPPRALAAPGPRLRDPPAPDVLEGAHVHRQVVPRGADGGPAT